jgi:hypothetical protein
MSTILSAKSGNIDGKNVTGLAPITPCIGGLIVWYTQDRVVPREALEQKDNSEINTQTRTSPQ